jgi:hypothetical protein
MEGWRDDMYALIKFPISWTLCTRFILHTILNTKKKSIKQKYTKKENADE